MGWVCIADPFFLVKKRKKKNLRGAVIMGMKVSIILGSGLVGYETPWATDFAAAAAAAAEDKEVFCNAQK